MTFEMAAPEFLVVGHLVKDVVDNDWRPGGTVFYAALVAAKLGLRTAVLTSAGREVDASAALPGIEVAVSPSPRSTVFQNVYKEGRRTQFVRSIADAISLEALPEDWRETPIVLLGPVIDEVDDSFVTAFPHSLLGLGAQGWLRELDDEGRVHPAGAERFEKLLPSVTAVFASEEDTTEEVAASWAQRVPIVAFTQGKHGLTLWHKGQPQHIPTVPANEVDPTGAGDAFAAAFLVRWRETEDACESARFACACASFIVEAEGASRMPTREQVEERLRIAM
jgi:hypothetical protein